jgi:hypothetical protein
LPAAAHSIKLRYNHRVMKKSFEFTERQIEDDVRAQVSRVFHEARSVITQFILPNAEIKSPTIEETTSSPLAIMMRDVLDHAAGVREVVDVYGTCKRLLQIMHSKSLSQEGEVPASFWMTPVGAAIHECSGSFAGIADDTQLSEPEAARFLGVGQLTLLSYCQSGALQAQRRVGHRFLFTVAQLREFRKRKYGYKASQGL